ncbi:hypothetical protein [Gordonia caeni]|uniref:Uncharacterized protein n=1 Tax=Gordonia caeni TaxID=1007097 RepID=A0ABP7PBV2_9ACTN
MTRDERRQAFASMPDADPGKRMFLLGLRCAALQHETVSEVQRERVDGELLPQVRRIETVRKNNLRGELSLRIDKATALFADIMGDWSPRPDNPIARQVRAEIGIDL